MLGGPPSTAGCCQAVGSSEGGVAAEESPAAGLVCFFWEKKAGFVS